MRETHSAGGIVIGPHGEVVVVCQQGTSWSLPKGPIEKYETASEAAGRKVFEECGIEVEDLQMVRELGDYQRYKIDHEGVEDINEHKTISMFLFRTNVTELNPINGGITEAKWVPKYEVIKILTHHKDKEFFMKVLFELP